MRVKKYSLCEVFVRYVLPSLRMLLAEELILKYGFTQLEAARTLSIGQPLINYLLLKEVGEGSEVLRGSLSFPESGE